MADTKVEQLSVNVVKEPSMMTGAVPRKHWMDVPVTFKPGTTAIQPRKQLLNILAKVYPVFSVNRANGK